MYHIPKVVNKCFCNLRTGAFSIGRKQKTHYSELKKAGTCFTAVNAQKVFMCLLLCYSKGELNQDNLLINGQD